MAGAVGRRWAPASHGSDGGDADAWKRTAGGGGVDFWTPSQDITLYPPSGGRVTCLSRGGAALVCAGLPVDSWRWMASRLSLTCTHTTRYKLRSHGC
eukprot:1119002-Pyramimonas_sp.AAC.3